MGTEKENPIIPAAAQNSAPVRSAATHEEELDQELHGIYDDAADGDAKRDMSRLEQADHSLLKRVLVGITVFFSVLAVISWAGFFLFSPGRERFVGERVTVTIDGPTEVKSGELVSYAVRWKNDERVPIGTASLELRLPKTFTLQKTEPEAQDRKWTIGSVSPGSDGMITVEGVYLAPIDKEMDVQAILTYRPADFNSEFQKVSTKTVKVTRSVIGMEITGPTKVLPGDKVTLSLDYVNESKNEFRNLRIRGAWPDAFIPDGAEPDAIDERYHEWKIDILPAEGKGSIKVTGTFASAAEGAIDIKAQAGFLGPDDSFELQKEAVFATTVLRGDLVTSLILNGKTDNQPVRFGDTLRYAVTYKNTGTATLEDITLSVSIEPSEQGKLVNWNELEDRASGVRDGNKITWTKKQIPSLERIGANEEGTLDFSVPVIAAPIAGATSTDYQVVSSLEARVQKIDGDTVGRTAKTQPMVARFLSDTSFTATARYFSADNVPVGTGPLPPEVGKQTTYRVTWKIDNALHELGDLRLSAKLPANVEWTGLSTIDAGDLKFDAASEKMLWTLNWMPTGIKTLTISFDVRLTPNEGDKGRIPMLVDAAIFEALDRGANYSMLLTTPPLTTALDGDDFAAGKSRVQ